MQGVETPNFKHQANLYTLGNRCCVGLALTGTLTLLGTWLLQNRWATSLSFKVALLTGSATCLVAARILQQRSKRAEIFSCLQTSCQRLKDSIQVEDSSPIGQFIQTVEKCLQGEKLGDHITSKDLSMLAHQCDKLSTLVVFMLNWKTLVDSCDPACATHTQNACDQLSDTVNNWCIEWTLFFSKPPVEASKRGALYEEQLFHFFSTFCLNWLEAENEVSTVDALKSHATQLQNSFNAERASPSLPLGDVLRSQITYILKESQLLEISLLPENPLQQSLIERTMKARLDNLHQWCNLLEKASKDYSACCACLDDLMLHAVRANHYHLLCQNLIDHPTQLSFFPMPFLKNGTPTPDAIANDEQELKKQSQVFAHILPFYDPFFVTDQHLPSVLPRLPRPSTNSQPKELICTIYNS